MRPEDKVTVFLRDENLYHRGTLKVIEASAVLKKNDISKWSIVLDGNHAISKLVRKGWGVIVYSGDTFQFSGPIDNIKHVTKDKTKDLVIGGVTDMHVISDAVVYPDPYSIPSAQGTDYWAEKGPAETLMVNLFNAQCGPAALPARKYPGVLTAVSTGLGPTTSIKARLTNVLTELQALATVGNLTFEVIQVPDTQNRELVIRAPRDLTRSVKFTSKSGIGDFETDESAPKATTVIVGGQGEGVARTLIEANATDGGWGRRIEIFQDRRDTDDIDELNKATTETLETNKAIQGVSFSVTETPLHKFGKHYLLGDMVSIQIPDTDEIITDVVNAVEIDWTAHSKEITVIVGEEDTPAKEQRDQLILEKLRRLEAR